MAWFHFCTVNHNETGRATLVDMAAWFEAGLLELGHKVTFSDAKPEQRAINVFWEFFDPRSAKELAASSITYGIVATEIPDGHAFNWRQEPWFKTRFDSFCEAAKGASFIWAMVESALPFYARFCPAAYMELGFSERLIPDYIDQTPDGDFCFFGLRTPYRERVIEGLRKYAAVEWPEAFLSSGEVGKLIARNKVGVSLKKSEQWIIPSPTRLGRLMMAKRGVAAETVPVPTRQGEIAGLCPDSCDFSDYLIGVLDNWRPRAEQAFARYKAEMPMSQIMQGVLDRTVANNASLKRRNLFHRLTSRLRKSSPSLRVL